MTQRTDDELEQLTGRGARGARFHMLPGGAVPWEIMPAVAEKIAPFGWHIQLQMNGRDLIDRFDTLVALPTPLVVDHVGRFMPPVDPDDERFSVLLRLLDTGRCWVKLSAPYESAVDPTHQYEAVGRLVHALIEHAPDRMLWATNWPHPGQADPPSLNHLARLAFEWMPDDTTRRRILVDNPSDALHVRTHRRVMTAHYASYPSLVDRTVFITGGADGIGSAMVQQFALQGSKVAFVDKNVPYAHATIQRCVDAGATHAPIFFEVDLLDIAALQTACADAVTALGGVSVLVNNAANDDRHDWRDVTPEYFDNRINTNLRHYFFAIQALAPQMLEAGSGSIVNIGSSSYMMKEDGFPGYAIAKSAVEGITRTMARTFGPRGVRVNTVLPGWVPTERQLAKWWTPEGEQRTMDNQSIKRRIVPEEFAQMVLFLAADDGAACTAQQFLVDGGRR